MNDIWKYHCTLFNCSLFIAVSACQWSCVDGLKIDKPDFRERVVHLNTLVKQFLALKRPVLALTVICKVLQKANRGEIVKKVLLKNLRGEIVYKILLKNPRDEIVYKILLKFPRGEIGYKVLLKNQK